MIDTLHGTFFFLLQLPYLRIKCISIETFQVYYASCVLIRSPGEPKKHGIKNKTLRQQEHSSSGALDLLSHQGKYLPTGLSAGGPSCSTHAMDARPWVFPSLSP